MKKEKKQQAGAPLSERLRQRLRVQNEDRLYFVLQLLFGFTQILLAYVAFLANNLAQTGTLLMAIFGALLMLLAGKCWKSRAVRVLVRVIAALAVLGFTAIIVIDALTTQITDTTGFNYVTRATSDYVGQILANLCLMVQPLVLLLFIVFAIAARRGEKKADMRILQIGSWLLPVFAIVTLVLAGEEGMTRLAFTGDLLGVISNQVLLIAYLVCTLASVLAVFMAYPFGVKAVKKAVEKARAKLAEKK